MGGELLGSQLDGLMLEDNLAGLAVGLLDLVGVDLVALLPVVRVCCLCYMQERGRGLIMQSEPFLGWMTGNRA